MDKYGTVEVTREDADMVRTALAQCGSVVFSLGSADRVGAMIVLVCTQFEQIGVMPFGGRPIGRAYVGIYGRGCNHLGMAETHPGYIEEKLKISADDAEAFAAFWALIWEENRSGAV